MHSAADAFVQYVFNGLIDHLPSLPFFISSLLHECSSVADPRRSWIIYRLDKAEIWTEEGTTSRSGR